jgi:hypothetical protein
VGGLEGGARFSFFTSPCIGGQIVSVDGQIVSVRRKKCVYKRQICPWTDTKLSMSDGSCPWTTESVRGSACQSATGHPRPSPNASPSTPKAPALNKSPFGSKTATNSAKIGNCLPGVSTSNSPTPTSSPASAPSSAATEHCPVRGVRVQVLARFSKTHAASAR